MKGFSIRQTRHGLKPNLHLLTDQAIKLMYGRWTLKELTQNRKESPKTPLLHKLQLYFYD